MGKPIRKLQKSDIHKNASSEVSHSIRRMKEKEAKYTILLVLFFMILFGFIGYFTLRVNSLVVFNSMKEIQTQDYGISLSSTAVTLTREDIMTDEEGRETKPYLLTVDNRTNRDIQYRIVFVEDRDQAILCGCDENPILMDFVHFSFQEEEISSLADSFFVVGEGYLMHGHKIQLNVRLWLTASEMFDSNSHLHGYFVLEEL